jgi:hypothetical protein
VPSSSIDNLGDFADFVISNPQHFKKTTERRARFYKNVIEKRGGSNSTYHPAYTPPRSNDMSTEAMQVFFGMGGGIGILYLINRYGIPAVRQIITATARAMGFRGNQVGIENEVLDAAEDETQTDIETDTSGSSDTSGRDLESVSTGDGRRRRVGGRDYSKDEGKSLGFFGNIQRAFDTSFNKKPTEKEKPVLKGIFGAEKLLTDNIIKPLAPPVGIVAEKQRQFLENKYGGMVRRCM